MSELSEDSLEDITNLDRTEVCTIKRTVMRIYKSRKEAQGRQCYVCYVKCDGHKYNCVDYVHRQEEENEI